MITKRAPAPGTFDITPQIGRRQHGVAPIPTDSGGIDEVPFPGEGGGDYAEDFWREAIDGDKTILEASRRHPNRPGSRRYLANLGVTKVRPLTRRDGGVYYTSSSLKRNVSGLDASFEE